MINAHLISFGKILIKHPSFRMNMNISRCFEHFAEKSIPANYVAKLLMDKSCNTHTGTAMNRNLWKILNFSIKLIFHVNENWSDYYNRLWSIPLRNQLQHQVLPSQKCLGTTSSPVLNLNLNPSDHLLPSYLVFSAELHFSILFSFYFNFSTNFGIVDGQKKSYNLPHSLLVFTWRKGIHAHVVTHQFSFLVAILRKKKRKLESTFTHSASL